MARYLVTPFDLSKAIIDGKAERKRRAQQKIQEGLMLIRSLNNNNVSGGEEQSNIDYPALPIEMWDKVLKYVVETRDLEAAWQTCPLYRDILNERRISEILIPQVLQVEAFRQGLELEGLLNLRPLGRSVRNVIDRWNDRGWENEALRPWVILSNPRLNLRSILLVFPFASPDSDDAYDGLKEAEAYNLEWSFNPANPNRCERFLPGSIEISFGNLENMGDEGFIAYRTLCTKILQHIGSQLSDFRLYMGATDKISPCDLYMMLFEWVRLVPNIVLFSLDFDSAVFADGDASALINTISENPFPTLKKLKRVDLYSFEGAEKVFEEIMRSNTQVEHVWLYPSFPMGEQGASQVMRSMTPISFTTSYSLIMTSPILEFNWPLKALGLSFHSGRISATSLFRIFENFQTLETVELSLWDVVVESDGTNVSFLNLPQLTHFNFELSCGRNIREFYKSPISPEARKDSHYFLCVDYLLKCRKLEKLTWRSYFPFRVCTRDDIEDMEELVQFKAGFANFAESNIWAVFPFLKSVRVFDPINTPQDDDWNKTKVFTKPRN